MDKKQGRLWLLAMIAIPAIFVLVFWLGRRDQTTPWATADQVEAAANEWASMDDDCFVSVSDTRSVRAALNEILNSNQLMSPVQKSAFVDTVSRFLVSMERGNSDFDKFIAVRLPPSGSDYEVIPEAGTALVEYSPLDNASERSAIENYRAIWEQNIKPVGIWDKVCFDVPEPVRTSTLPDAGLNAFAFPEFMTSTNFFYVFATKPSPFDFGALVRDELEARDEIVTANVFFMADCGAGEGRRPYGMTFFWSTKHQAWVNYQFSYGFINTPKVLIRFF